MATKLPRGIQLVQWKNHDGTTTTKYRVRILRKGFKADERFDDLQEAKEFLALSKATKGKEIIYKITEQERLASQPDNQDDGNYSFGYFIDRYIKDYVLTRPQLTELEKRNTNNILSFYKTIRNTSIVNRHLDFFDKQELGMEDMPVPVFMHAFDIRNIKAIEINLYIKERLKHVKPSSISREITHISNVFSKLQYFNESLADLQNPTRHYDKDLLKNRNPKREIAISAAEEEKFFRLLSERDNKQIYNIAKISVLTALRRSEIITLTRSQIKDNYIQLTYTKSGRPRKVFIDKQAKDFLDSLPTLANDRLFTYTVSGFDRVFRAFTKRHNLSHIHFHDLRRIAISRKIVQIGSQNSVFISEFLGIASVSKLEQFHIDKQEQAPTNQQQALYSFGHAFPQTTKIYFNMPVIKEKK